MRSTPISLAFCSVMLFACGGGGNGGSDAGDDTTPDATPVSSFVPLLAGDWTMPVNQEGYYCVRATITQDMYIHAFKPIAPVGTHHTALAIDTSGGPDGGFPCTAGDIGFKLLFGSGVGTTPYTLPDGVAFKLTAGQKVILNLHLYNTTDTVLNGHSGVEVETIAPAAVAHEAETLYGVDFNLTVPSGVSTYTGTCTIHGNSTIVGLFPHMHKRGTHINATLMSGGNPQVFFDMPYSFSTQLNYEVAQVDASDGDQVKYECSFDNPGAPVTFGQSTDDEMCVLGMYRYPPSATTSICTN